MPDSLRPVAIRDLEVLGEQGRRWVVDQLLPQLETLTPVRGWVSAIHGGTVLEVSGCGETVITLCCDRCLLHYNHALRAEDRELIWLGDPSVWDPGGDSVADPGQSALTDGFSDGLDPRGCFDPARWLFEQLSLRLPPVNRCGPDCPGPDIPADPGEAAGQPSAMSAVDPRWSALRTLQDTSEP